MKRIKFLSLVIVSAFLLTNCKKDEVKPVGSNEMEIKQKQVPILFKITGETCFYCGDWGWKTWIDLANKFKDGKGLSWANYGDGFSNSFFRNQEINPTMNILENMMEEGGGKPNFAANGIDYSTSAANAEAAALAKSLEKAKVSATLTSKFEGDTLKIRAAAKFFENMTGEFYMGAYLIENNVLGPQSGPIGTKGNVPHHFVMRGSLSTSAWGEQIVATDAKAGNYFEKTYTVTVPSTFKKENFSYGIIIWKKDGTKYSYVNAFSTQ